MRSPQIIGWMAGTCSMMVGRTVTASYTGKPLDFGGSHGRSQSTARGVSLCIRQVCERLERWMKAAFENVWLLHSEHGVDMRTAAGILAVRRMVNAIKVLGIWPVNSRRCSRRPAAIGAADWSP